MPKIVLSHWLSLAVLYKSSFTDTYIILIVAQKALIVYQLAFEQ